MRGSAQRGAALACALILGTCASPAADFTIVILPDTQFYTAGMHGGSPALFEAQTRWIAGSRDSLNIVFVTQLGDVVQHGDSVLAEWQAADAAMSLLEDPAATGRPEGIPFGVAVGNHDQSPAGSADGTTTLYNRFFGASRFEGRTYYGGHFGASNDNHYELFEAGGRGFVVVHLEYDTTPDQNVLAWARGVLRQNADRRAIVVMHHLIGTGDPADFSPQGQAVFDALADSPNVFLMLGGHVSGELDEGRRTDRGGVRAVVSLLADYQGRAQGGDGWLRLLEFSPVRGEIRVRTFSPILSAGAGAFETDADSDFVLSYDPGA